MNEQVHFVWPIYNFEEEAKAEADEQKKIK